jgi:hypothetical protein
MCRQHRRDSLLPPDITLLGNLLDLNPPAL